MNGIEIITAIRYIKAQSEFIVTTKNSISGRIFKTYANHLTEAEKSFAKSYKSRMVRGLG